MKLLEWIACGKVGISSRTMWLAITGIIEKPERMSTLFNVPMDRSDFAQCLQMVNSYYVSKEQLEKVKIPFPWFSPIIDHWDELVQLYNVASDYKSGMLLYNRLHELMHECMIIDGFIEVRSGYWQRQSANV